MMLGKSLLLLLMLFVFSIAATAQQEQEEPTGDLSTPKEVAFQHIFYLQEENKNFQKAAEALVGKGKKVTEKTIDLAKKLKQIFDGKGLYIRPDMIPDAPDFIDSTTGNAVYVLFPKDLPEVYIVRPLRGKNKRDRNYANYWRYSPETVAQIEALHESVYPLGSSILLELVPQGGAKVLGLASWQYVAIVLLILIALLLNFITWRILNFVLRVLANTRLGKNHFDPEIVKKIAIIISYMVVAYVLLLFTPVLQLPVGVSFYLLAFARVFNTICAVIVLLHSVELARSYFETVVAKTDSTSDDQLLPIFIRILKTLVIIGGGIHILDVFDVDLTALIAGLSIGGLALALAAQDTVKHLIGSVMIYADKPFQLGDFIDGNGITGTVEDIGFRSTRIRTPDSSLITVPNGALVDMTMNNMGELKFRRFNTTIGVAYYTPPALIQKFLEGLRAMNQAHPRTKNDVSFIYLNNMGGSSLDIMFVAYLETTDYAVNLQLKEELIFGILNLAEALNVHIAFPSTSVYIESMPEKKGQMPEYSPAELSAADKEMQQFLEDFKNKYPDKI